MAIGLSIFGPGRAFANGQPFRDPRWPVVVTLNCFWIDLELILDSPNIPRDGP